MYCCKIESFCAIYFITSTSVNLQADPKRQLYIIVKASDLFVKALENGGVEYVFGVPGEANLNILESLRISKIRFILARHPQASALMATTYSRLKGKTGVCLCTEATSPITVAAYAQIEGIPLLIITTQESLNDRQNNRRTYPQYGSQPINMIKTMATVTKASQQITHANDIAELVHQSFQTAKRQRPGAVYLALSEDVAKQEVTSSRLFSTHSTPFMQDSQAYQVSIASLIPRKKATLGIPYQSRSHHHDYPMHIERIVIDTKKALSKGAIMTIDNGLYKAEFVRYHTYSTHDSAILLADNGQFDIGASLPSAISCALMYPQREVMAVCGDGSFMMHSQELETAMRLNLSIVVIVIRDDAHGRIRQQQARQQLADFGLSYGNPDFVKYAISYGAKGHRIQTPEQLVPTIKQSYQYGGVHVIEIPVDYGESIFSPSH